jgi:ATPase family associated with various cellular activities (AAA)
MTNESEPIALETDVLASAERLRDSVRRLLAECSKVVVGQSDVLEQLVLAILARGHCLLVGVPGLAKTLMVRTLADGMNLSFSRVQFTPDLMPSDITGTDILQEDKSTGGRAFRFVHGPIFANIVLADEINRTPPKTQAALLEAMQERQVTVAGQRHKLPDPFFVLATQNPIEQEGTYPLPEAQQDRFMFDIRVEYPDENEEFRIIEATTSPGKPRLDRIGASGTGGGTRDPLCRAAGSNDTTGGSRPGGTRFREEIRRVGRRPAGRAEPDPCLQGAGFTARSDLRGDRRRQGRGPASPAPPRHHELQRGSRGSFARRDRKAATREFAPRGRKGVTLKATGSSEPLHPSRSSSGSRSARQTCPITANCTRRRSAR